MLFRSDVKISATDNKTTTITTTDNNEPENELYDYNDTIAMSIDQEVKGDSTVANTLSKSEESTNPTLSNNNDETTEQNSNITTISLVIIAIFIPLLIAFFTVKLNKTNKNTKNKQKIM